MEQPVVEYVQVRRQLKIRFVDVANRRRRAFAQERSGPVRLLIVERARAEGMDVHRDRARHELEIRLCERTGHRRSVPTIIECAIRHRITVRKNIGRVFEDERHTRLVQLIANFREPTIADVQSARRIMRPVDVSAAP